MTRSHLFSLLVLAFLSGCVTPITYSPNPGLVEQMGPEAAHEEFATVLKRSRTPEVTEVLVEGEKYIYKWRGQAGPAGTYAHDGERAVYFNNVDRVDLYPNFKAFVYNGDMLLADYHFNSLGDAQRFADLIWSFKAQQNSGN